MIIKWCQLVPRGTKWLPNGYQMVSLGTKWYHVVPMVPNGNIWHHFYWVPMVSIGILEVYLMEVVQNGTI